MLLPFTEDLVLTSAGDAEMALLADRHYSRRKRGSRQFLYAGRKLVIHNSEGTILFGWLWELERCVWIGSAVTAVPSSQ